MTPRPAITEEQVTEASRTFQASVQRLGNKAVCGTRGGACMCQPGEHEGGKGACGRVIDVDTVQRKTPLDAKARMTHEAITAIQRAHGIVARH